MKRADVSVSELAEASGVPRQRIHEYLTSDTLPRWDVVQKLADALKCKTDDLR